VSAIWQNAMMQLARRHVRLSSWLISLAVLFNAIAPSLAHQLSGARGQSLTLTICSGGGLRALKLVALDGASAPQHQSESAMAQSDCPLCQLHAQPYIPSADQIGVASFGTSAAPSAARGEVSDRSPDAWAVRLPRAPPAQA
jgi:Protein of unknown function (DUF2946)